MELYMMYLASLEEEMKDKVAGYFFLHTKEDLDRVVADNTVANTVVIRGDFSSEFFTPTGLSLYVEEAKKLNPNINIEVDSGNGVVTYDYIIKKIGKCRNLEELIQLLVTYDKEAMNVVRELVTTRTQNRKQMLEYSNQIARLQSVNNGYRGQLADLELSLRQEQQNKLQFQSRLLSLIGRINYQYNIGLDRSKLFVLNDNEYDKVLYFKETSRVQYTDSFLYYLKEILKVLYTMPTRMIVIEAYYATGKVQQYPDFKCHHSLFEEDVLSGDILMLGVQPKLMEDILRNPSRISILIVLDRGGYEVPHLIGDNVEYFYMASDPKDVPEDVPKNRIISYSEDTLYIKYIKGFEQMDHSKRISEYSSSNIIKTIVNLIEGRGV